MNKKILFVVLLAVILLPTKILAVATIADMAGAIATQVVKVGEFIVIIMWIVTGILFLTAQGDPGKLNAAKTGLFASIAGTIIIIIAVNAVTFVKNSFGI